MAAHPEYQKTKLTLNLNYRNVNNIQTLQTNSFLKIT